MNSSPARSTAPTLPGGIRPLVGAAFLMATSAIGPGFLTQTAVFTGRLGASFGFAILVSIACDLAAQINIWRLVVAARLPAQALADRVVPRLGSVLAVAVAAGGLAFNIGNVAGAGLGLNAALGWQPATGSVVSSLAAVALFLAPEAGRAMDRFSQAMGILMIILAGYVAWAAHPPLGEVVIRTVWPAQLDGLAVVTIVGGTVGGYITFAGAHRLLDAGIAGPEAVGRATRSATLGIGVASVMRLVLFLGAFGVVHQGLALDPANPSASVFQYAAGNLGYRFFGIVMWAASITSIIGSAYTSVTFLRTLHPALARRDTPLLVGFIAVSTVILLLVGRPVTVLVLVGAINGLILPGALAAILTAARNPAHFGTYRHPGWLAAAGWGVVLLMGGLGIYTMINDVPRLFR